MYGRTFELISSGNMKQNYFSITGNDVQIKSILYIFKFDLYYTFKV